MGNKTFLLFYTITWHMETGIKRKMKIKKNNTSEQFNLFLQMTSSDKVKRKFEEICRYQEILSTL